MNMPVLEMLKSLLQNHDIFSEIANSHPVNNPAIMSGFSDGLSFQMNDLFIIQQNISNSVIFLIFSDDFEVYDPIGTLTKKHKLNSMYYTLENITPKI